MPIYEYQCEKCEHVTEALRSMSQADEPVACEQCGHDNARRIQSVTAATTGSPGGGDMPLPMGGCGRCGDPNGPCAMG